MYRETPYIFCCYLCNIFIYIREDSYIIKRNEIWFSCTSTVGETKVCAINFNIIKVCRKVCGVAWGDDYGGFIETLSFYGDSKKKKRILVRCHFKYELLKSWRINFLEGFCCLFRLRAFHSWKLRTKKSMWRYLHFGDVKYFPMNFAVINIGLYFLWNLVKIFKNKKFEQHSVKLRQLSHDMIIPEKKSLSSKSK